MLQAQHLTSTYDELTSKRIAETANGQAHWAGTGPDGKTCQQYAHYHKDKRCDEYKKLTGRRGLKFAAEVKACRFFDEKH